MSGNLDGNIMGIKPVVGSKNDVMGQGKTIISILKQLRNVLGLGGFDTGFDSGHYVYSSDVTQDILTLIDYIENTTYGLSALKDKLDDIDDSIFTLTETGGTLTTDGTEQNVYINNAPSALFNPKTVLIDFTNHGAGETVVIREYYRIKSGGNLIKVAENTYAAAQDPALIQVDLCSNRYGLKVTAEKTAGANADYDYEVLYEA